MKSTLLIVICDVSIRTKVLKPGKLSSNSSNILQNAPNYPKVQLEMTLGALSEAIQWLKLALLGISHHCVFQICYCNHLLWFLWHSPCKNRDYCALENLCFLDNILPEVLSTSSVIQTGHQENLVPNWNEIIWHF